MLGVVPVIVPVPVPMPMHVLVLVLVLVRVLVRVLVAMSVLGLLAALVWVRSRMVVMVAEMHRFPWEARYGTQALGRCKLARLAS
ncbi:MAG TPA: hypothetical protein PLJ12_09715 [Planctomycetota bacterium]|nr:hypothetical protein [Planctomycetota bacterium]